MEDLAAVAIGVLAATVTGTATHFGQESAAAVVHVVRERLGSTRRGQTALAELEAAPGDPRARDEAVTALRGEVREDPDLQRTLAMHLDTSTAQTSGSVTFHGSKVRGSQIALGSITVNKPGSTGATVGLVVVVLALVALIVYGGVSLFSDASADNGEEEQGKPGTAVRALSAAETERMLPGLSDLPGKWTMDRPPFVEDGSKCHAGRADYRGADGNGRSDVKLRFEVYACPNAQTAARGYTDIVKARQNPAGYRESPYPAKKWGDESTMASYTYEDSELADPSQVGQHLMARARVGTVVLQMHYGPDRDLPDFEQRAEELVRVMCERARAAQASS
ncbi:hypothetical protein [Streptomyces sp. NPDC093094]|uniref:hypothetical protein n=1 Tax=Streptomyces sp. NPDC093094 TaxID=3366026 RepID=UPI00380561FB